MKRTVLFSGFLLLGLQAYAAASSVAEVSLAKRFVGLGISAESLFHPPKNVLDKRFLEAGRLHFWQRYGTAMFPGENDFKGYILLADPYHSGLERISFLLGSDCSRFVHRLYQILGAAYPYAKTRHFIHLGQAMTDGIGAETYYFARSAEAVPVDLPLCRWKELYEKFTLVEPTRAKTEVGDVVVFPKVNGERGVRGHMGVVSKVAPLMLLHSKSSSSGVVEEPFDGLSAEVFIFRWREELLPLAADSLEAILGERIAPDPSRCAN